MSQLRYRLRQPGCVDRYNLHLAPALSLPLSLNPTSRHRWPLIQSPGLSA